MVNLVISLSQNVQAYKQDQCKYRMAEIRSLLSSIIENERGLIPSTGEIDCWIKDLIEGDGDYIYVLCDKKTREPLDGWVETYNESYDGPNNEGLAARGLEWILSKVVKAEQEAIQEKARVDAAIKSEQERIYTTPAEYKAITDFAREHGKQWKRELKAQWEAGTAPPALQYLGTHPNFGQNWLSNFKLPKNFW